MSFNQQICIGHVGADPDFAVTPSGVPVCNVSVATNKKWTEKNTGEKQEKTTWHRVVFFNRLAEIARDHLRKGSLVMVAGETEHQKYTDKNNGQDRYSTKIIARELQMLGNKGEGRQSNNNQQRAGAPQNIAFDADIQF